MKITFKIFSFLFFIASTQSFTKKYFASSQCLPNQKSLLLELRNNLQFPNKVSTKLITWNQSKDCCDWNGVKCNNSNGQVTELDLSEEGITGTIDNLSCMFRLQHLTHLNLAFNYFYGNIPSSIGNLFGLTYLNLNNTRFSGEVPIQISQLVHLVVLDLSTTKFGGGSDPYNYPTLQVNTRNLELIMQNLTKLKEVYLGGVLIQKEGSEWGKVLSSLNELQILSMPSCDLTGGFHPSLANLRSLSEIDLNYNNLLSAPVPEFFAAFNNLTSLSMCNCSLTGTFPQKMFQLPALTTLYLSYNPDLMGTIPSSIGKLKGLIELNLYKCNFQGIIPQSLGNLPQLEYLDLSFNNFSGPVPVFQSADNLEFLLLGSNSLTGKIPELMFSEDSKLRCLYLSSNHLEGMIPKTIFQLRNLEVLMVSHNKLSGTLKLYQMLTSLQCLDTLELSYNHLTIDTSNTDANSSFPLLQDLSLASCNLHILPEFLKKQQNLYRLDLSKNHIQGKIPRWIWSDKLYLLNLSYNSFVKMENFPSPFPSNFHVLDLHGNNIQGELPVLPSQIPLEFLDLSSNNFNTLITHDFGSSLSTAQFLSLAHNKIYGNIPKSLCNATNLRILDLSHNHFNGTIPLCLAELTQNLAILNLRRNSLHGAIPDTFRENCMLETLDSNMNNLEGKIPRSISNCKNLRVLDLGNNQLTDTFPCHLKNLSSLQVLVLRSNQLQGVVICPMNIYFLPLLQIIDIASNNFSGQLLPIFHGRRMMIETNETHSNPDFLQYQTNNSAYTYYQDDVVVTYKSYEFEMQKILTIFTSIDLSNNAFHGEIPQDLGNLSALKVFNLSHNSISGKIPQSIGNLSQIESLDLSHNTLSGSIPQTLASLSFIGYLDLSFNNLTGLIPTSTQLQSFDASAYEGNRGLYGTPLTNGKKDTPGRETRPPESHLSSKTKLQLMLSGGAVGYAVGIILFFGPLVCISRLREWYNYHVDKLLMRIPPIEESRKRNRSKKSRRNRRY